jgi:hypothetical protein
MPPDLSLGRGHFRSIKLDRVVVAQFIAFANLLRPACHLIGVVSKRNKLRDYERGGFRQINKMVVPTGQIDKRAYMA